MSDTSPVFVARFLDKEVTRMTVHTPAGKLDLRRGIKLSIAAYETRIRNRRQQAFEDDTPVEVPPIVKAHFENDKGEVLETYDAEELE
jgi:hypothetical protein